MDVGFGHVGDAQFLGLGGIDVLLHVAIRIDDDGFAGSAAGDQVAVLSDERFEESLDDHVGDVSIIPGAQGTCHIFTRDVNRLPEWVSRVCRGVESFEDLVLGGGSLRPTANRLAATDRTAVIDRVLR